MDPHSHAPAPTLRARLTPGGRVEVINGIKVWPPANWQVRRCFPYGDGTCCLVSATINRRAYFAHVSAADLGAAEQGDGLVVLLERAPGA